MQLDSSLMHALLLAAISLPYFLNLGKSSIWDANEAFYAETPREMLTSGNYLAPQFNFQVRAQKPPLTYWAVLICYKVFGVNELAVRLPGALASLGVLLFSYGIARALFGTRAALIAAFFTATTPRIFIMARRLPIDILLLFFITGTLFFLVRAIRKNETRSWVLAYLCAGLGFLTKGPVAIAIPAGAYLCWALWTRRLSLISARPLMGSAILILVALPWYLLIYSRHGWTYIAPFFLRDNLGRFATESLGPSRGLLYYFPVYLIDFFPWSLPALFSVYRLWVHRRDLQPLRSFSFGLPLIWCALTFVLFSLSRNKQEYYIAPLYPALSIVLAGVWDRSFRSAETLPAAAGLKTATTPGCLRLYWLLCLSLLAISVYLPKIIRSFMPGIPLVLHYAPSIVLFGSSVLLAWTITSAKTQRSLAALAIPIWIVYVFCALLYVPALESFRPVKSFCRRIEAKASGPYQAGWFGTALPSMVYYLRRPIFEENSAEQMRARFHSDVPVYCILTGKDYQELF